MQIATGLLCFASFLFLLKGRVVLKKFLVSANEPFDRHVNQYLRAMEQIGMLYASNMT